MHEKPCLIPIFINEPAHDKTCNKTCVTSKDSDQPVHPLSMARILVYPSLDNPEAVEGTCDQRRLWSDCVDAQADLSPRWLHKSYCRFCRSLAHLWTVPSEHMQTAKTLISLHNPSCMLTELLDTVELWPATSGYVPLNLCVQLRFRSAWNHTAL